MAFDFSRPGVRVNDKLSLPPAFLRKWIDVLEEYRRKVEGDLPWWYHERTQIGFLAAAAWRARGGAALEEWRTDKTSADGSKRNGRGDLWIQLGKRYWHIEAKRASVRLGSSPYSAVTRTRAALRDACDDAAAIKAYRGERRIGVAFVAPVIAHKRADDAERRVSLWLQELRARHCGAIAWLLDRHQFEARGGQDVHPGIVLISGRARTR
jgi:hypothetical protein